MALRGRERVADTLRDRIVTGLHVGRYRGGERLPSARALADEFDVNERVVLAALNTLASDGFLVLRPRSGAYIAPPHPASGEALPDLGRWLVDMLVDARSRGLPPRDVGGYVERCLETRRLRAACIECNGDQLHLLCTELSADHGFAATSAEVDELRSSELPTSVIRADVLVTTMFHAADVRPVAERLDKPWIAVALRADVVDEVTRRLRDGPVYYIATDDRFEAKLRRMLGRRARLSNLRVLLTGRDDLDSIPPDAPTFIMTSAREYVTARYGRTGPGRPFHPPRQFSDASARELLTLVVRANLSAIAAGLE